MKTKAKKTTKVPVSTLTANGHLRPAARRAPAEPSLALPRYELRARRFGPADTELEVWQLPSPASPRLVAPMRVAGLRGRNLELIEHRVSRRLKQAGVSYEVPALRLSRAWAIPEDVALTLGLLFRSLAPMRSRDNLRGVIEGIEAMGKEESAYWLGMAIHRRSPRRVLAALRMLLSSPKPRAA